jgi:lipopolysaccharide export LptBFGC system permease protein LptF
VLSLGYARILPPVLSAWIVPAIFGIAAAYLFQKIPE